MEFSFILVRHENIWAASKRHEKRGTFSPIHEAAAHRANHRYFTVSGPSGETESPRPLQPRAEHPEAVQEERGEQHSIHPSVFCRLSEKYEWHLFLEILCLKISPARDSESYIALIYEHMHTYNHRAWAAYLHVWLQVLKVPREVFLLLQHSMWNTNKSLSKVRPILFIFQLNSVVRQKTRPLSQMRKQEDVFQFS